MEPVQLRQRFGRHAQQELPQRAGIGVRGQATEVAKDPVGLQERGRLDALEAQDHGVEDREQQLAHGVAVVSLSEGDLFGDRCLEADSGEEAMQQVHTTEVCETARAKVDCQPAWTLPIR
ncbi:MAG: hypothetical protein HY725_00750 [Candidatus Rokubacteria bacterium]|nr:hypothetical protein [Candidatus Rokubacteria bacterium]